MSFLSRTGAPTLREKNEVKGIISTGQNTLTLDRSPYAVKAVFRGRSTFYLIFKVEMLMQESWSLSVGHHLIGALPLPPYQIVPLWTGLAGLVGPLTVVSFRRASQWTSAPVGLERQLTFRPYQELLASAEFVPFSKASRMLSDKLKQTAGDPLWCSKWLV